MRNKIRKTENATGIGSTVLIPVDFSKKDDIALEVGFALARRLDLHVDILHASPIPVPGAFPQFPDEFNGVDNIESEINEVEIENELHKIDDVDFRKIKKSINAKIANGEMPNIDYTTISLPGMPEEVIAQYCESTVPATVVMATRNLSRRKEELIGSVTAEVIDVCRVPVFSIPETYHFDGFQSINRLCAFCYLEGGDKNGIDTLMKMFGNPEVRIYLFPATTKLKTSEIDSKLNALYEELRESFPNATFEKVNVGDSIKRMALDMFENDNIQMIVAPNKKRNAFQRFFHPGLPHRILFEKDIPMLAIPV